MKKEVDEEFNKWIKSRKIAKTLQEQDSFLEKLISKSLTGKEIKPLFRSKEISKRINENKKFKHMSEYEKISLINEMHRFYRPKRQNNIDALNSNENLTKENKRLEKENSRLLEGKYKKYFNVWRLETEGMKGKKQYYYNVFIKTRPTLKNYPYKKFSDNNRQDLSKTNKLKNMQV